MDIRLLIDSRWSGNHGIGRFSSEVIKRIPFKYVCVPQLLSIAHPFDPLFLSFIAYFRRPKVFFTPGFSAPFLFRFKFILTLHDLNHIDRRENGSFFKKIYYWLILRRACQKAFCVFTVSEFSRQRIISWANVSPNRVVNVGNGVDESYRPDVMPHDPGYPYILCVGNRKAHKNEPRVIKAFAKAKIDLSIRLVFTGSVTSELHYLCEKHGLGDRVIFAGRVPEEDLPGLYCGAKALVFPSLYEGFGLPVIESMACGTPVLTSNTTSLAEVGGDAALLVAPTSIDQIAAGIERLCSDEHLRKQLREKGIKRAAEFTWEKTASKVREVLIAAGVDENSVQIKSERDL